MVRLKTAVSYSDNWTVDGSKAKGRKMTNDNIRQIVRSFNNECDAAITKVKYNNLPAAEKRIDTSFSQLNKMNASNKVGITISYLNLKKAELYLAYEYERKREDEKEALREQRQREKEEKALQKEIQSQKKIIDKDIKHYQNMIDELKQKLEKLTNEEDKKELENQIIEFYSKVSEKEEEKEELDYRTAHASAGYVYIISNIGAFGEDVFKIGVTRRLEPLERIGELSSASVPFRFDVHALIFSYEAYQLESELHEYFSSHRINKVNNRKEFFRIPIDVIEEKLKDYKDLTIDFTKTPDAEEYRESLNVNNQSI
jgi:DNA repair exonuclease SbcCD ATPase subunit